MRADALTHLTEAATFFRLGQESAGSDALLRAIEFLSLMLSSGQLDASVTGVLAELLAAQERADYLRVADLLQYVLAPQLQLV